MERPHKKEQRCSHAKTPCSVYVGQLDPSGFGLLHVKVPGQLRPLLTEALIAYSQRHAELHLDACHSSRLSALLRQLEHGFNAGATTRYQPMDVARAVTRRTKRRDRPLVLPRPPPGVCR